MSDLFKDQRPGLSDDEDRRLWQRVRAIPGEVAGDAPRASHTPWWRALWAMPAVRYGAPALAALVVAVVWVTERSPEPPARVNAHKASARAERQAARSMATTVAPPPVRAPVAGNEMAKQSRELDGALDDKELEAKKANAQSGADEPAVVQSEEAQRAPAEEPAPRAGALAKPKAQSQGFAAPPAAAPSPPHVRGGRSDEVPVMIDQPPATPRKDALNEGAARAPAATPRASSTLGAAKGAFGDLRREKASISVEHGVTDRLAAGSLPGAADLARHAILADVNDPARGGVGEAWVRIPEATAWAPEGSPDYTVRVGGRAGGKRLLRLSDGQEPVAYADVSANTRIAVLASLFEQALATPSPSRIRIEALRDEVRRVDKAEGGYGRARLLALLAGALTSLPER